MTTKTEKPAYMQAALAKQKIDKMRLDNVAKANAYAVTLAQKLADYIADLSPEVREIFDALDGAE